MNTIDNRLIAEFLGWEYTEFRDGGYYFTVPDELCPAPDCLQDDEYNKFFDAGLLFNSSWEWLMPVVEKIESLGHDVVIEVYNMNKQCAIFKKEDGGVHPRHANTLPFIMCSETDKRKATYRAVVEFIKWYNKIKGK